jgi:DNA-binding response OmpR family regulator
MTARSNEDPDFKGKRILVIEDDETFRELRLVGHLVAAGAEEQDIEQKNCVETALTELKEAADKYDLIFIDVMLPQTELDVELINDLNADLVALRQVIGREGQIDKSNHSAVDELQRAYERRPLILAQVRSLIGERSGLDMLIEWRKKCDHSREYPPFLFLTCVGSESAIEEGMGTISGHGEWLVKPVTVDDLLLASARLIAKGKKCLWTT